MKEFHVYIMSNHSPTLYIGFTSDIGSRVWQHKTGSAKGFTSRYKMDKLVYCETFRSPNEAIAREKQLKSWLRRKKVAFLEENNPDRDDLSSGWFGRQDSSLRSE
jgi:putative endonuclease